jgi:guanylate kinase
VFTDPATFEQRIAAGGFLEWTEFLGNYYGTPTPDPADGSDVVVLEIEVDGARQVKAKRPDALLIFVLPPSRAEQERRLRERGDPSDKVYARLRKAEDEEPIGRALADHVVVNDDLDDTIDEMLAIIEAARKGTG